MRESLGCIVGARNLGWDCSIIWSHDSLIIEVDVNVPFTTCLIFAQIYAKAYWSWCVRNDKIGFLLDVGEEIIFGSKLQVGTKLKFDEFNIIKRIADFQLVS